MNKQITHIKLILKKLGNKTYYTYIYKKLYIGISYNWIYLYRRTLSIFNTHITFKNNKLTLKRGQL